MINEENRNLDCISAENLFMIDCEDIFLREFRLQDLDELYALTLQTEITDYMPDWRGTREQYQDWVPNMYIKNNKEYLRAIPNIENNGLALGIILKEKNEFIGWCCSFPNDEIPKPNTEISYAISKYHRNKGYTTLAVKALLKYLFEQTNTEVLNLMALTYNLPSNRVIQKCGFKFYKNIELQNRPFNWYLLCKNDL